ncbi:signal peptidase complex catalytic subunit SEC11 [Myriangium duriaei CBS 260.36]|uniref:Signal peptidase complex catalytic subunit SEC11 n=1 Tax=Myriangium duriaei CBS 260.36 TaxID=1168546 RepID=A0A9P4IZZ7_9PEZI|nr:signal peptidase complex catalytic subunit SEC11 [Myriangium duriaei CBS 260.36]
MKPRQVARHVLNLCLLGASPYMLYKSFSVALNTSEPIVVVLSGSMEPAFRRGDLLVLNNWKAPEVGSIVVYKVKDKEIPIVHRVVQTHGGGPVPLQLLTKGDNNAVDDTELYAPGQRYLHHAPDQSYLNRSSDIVGSVVGFVPYVGYITCIMGDYPWLKTLMFVLMGLAVLLQNE